MAQDDPFDGLRVRAGGWKRHLGERALGRRASNLSLIPIVVKLAGSRSHDCQGRFIEATNETEVGR